MTELEGLPESQESTLQPSGFSSLSKENLSLAITYVPVVPIELKKNDLLRQLPKGDIAYIFAEQPDTAYVIDPVTLKPVMHNKKMVTYSIPENRGRRFAATIIATPALTPENIEDFAPLFKRASELLKNNAQKDELGHILDQSLGSMFVVEPKSEDKRKGWRQQAIHKATRTIKRKFDQEKEKFILTNIQVDNSSENVIITSGRLGKERGPIDLTQSPKIGSRIKSELDSLPIRYFRAGYKIDIHRLRKEAKASNFALRTIENVRDANNTDFVDLECGICRWHRDINGVQSRIKQCDLSQHDNKSGPPQLEDETAILSEALSDTHCPKCNTELRRNTYLKDFNKDADEVTLHVESFCQKPGCIGKVSDEKRIINSQMFEEKYVTRQSDMMEENYDEPETLQKNDYGFTPRDSMDVKSLVGKTETAASVSERPGPTCADYPEHGAMYWDKIRNMYICRVCGR